jgi:ribonuclease HI
MGTPKKYYAVVRGRNPGIYTSWFGPAGAEAQIRSFPGARYKGFPSLAEARTWMQSPEHAKPGARKKPPSPAGDQARLSPEGILVYTDGACRGNPGPGGYGYIIQNGEHRTEFAQGYRLTTNNRMELMACIAALEALKGGSEVALHSDSSYVVNGIEKGWARKWRARNWMRTPEEPALNADLWARLLDLCDAHRVRFVWVRGHAGHPENERCDALATGAAAGPGLSDDPFYRKRSGDEVARPARTKRKPPHTSGS